MRAVRRCFEVTRRAYNAGIYLVCMLNKSLLNKRRCDWMRPQWPYSVPAKFCYSCYCGGYFAPFFFSFHFFLSIRLLLRLYFAEEKKKNIANWIMALNWYCLMPVISNESQIPPIQSYTIHSFSIIIFFRNENVENRERILRDPCDASVLFINKLTGIMSSIVGWWHSTFH